MKKTILTILLLASVQILGQSSCDFHLNKMAAEGIVDSEPESGKCDPLNKFVSLPVRQIVGAEYYRRFFRKTCIEECGNIPINGELSTQCKQKLANGLRATSSVIKRYIRFPNGFLGCTYDGKVFKKYFDTLNGDNNSNLSEEFVESCFYTSKQVIQPAVSSCGNTPACVGSGYCTKGGGVPITVLCNAVEEKCPTIADCIRAPDPTWLKKGKDFFGVRSERSSGGASPR